MDVLIFDLQDYSLYGCDRIDERIKMVVVPVNLRVFCARYEEISVWSVVVVLILFSTEVLVLW